ncbi:MAG: 50S ribosomal protein L10 [Candidatus Babeliales bacterium]
MNRQEKEQVIESLKSSFSSNDASFLVKYKGLSVAQLTALRKELRQNGGAFHVAKVTLVKRAIKEIPALNGIVPMVGEQVALVFAKKESPAVAKILCDFASKNEAMELVGGYFEATVLDQAGLKTVGSLPSREQLLAQLCGLLKAPIAQFAFVLQEIAKTKEQSGAVAVASGAASEASE